jgi:hypothetical protein
MTKALTVRRVRVEWKSKMEAAKMVLRVGRGLRRKAVVVNGAVRLR